MFQSEIQAETLIADELQPLVLEARANDTSALTNRKSYDSSAEESLLTGCGDSSSIHEPESKASNTASLLAIPDEVNLWRIENLAVPACYLGVGLVQGMCGPLMNVYPLDLGATEAAQVTLSTVIIVPATLKVLYGFLSDCVPIAGARRKPYMFLGWAMVSCTMTALLVSTDLSMSYIHDGKDNYTIPVPPPAAPSIAYLSGLFFLLGVGLWLADVMGDSLVAEKTRFEPEHLKGNLQASCYACRFFGMMVAAPLSTGLYSTFGPSSIVTILAIAPVALMPLIVLLREDKPVAVRSVGDRLQDIWTTVKSRSVWQPMAFVYIYNLLQVSNGAWRQFQKTVLHFSEAQINFLLVISYALLYFGTMLYKQYFLRASWRRVYEVCIILNLFFSALQLLLIRGKTFGLSPFLFSLGDEAFAEFVKGIQFLPTTIMMVNLCPEGSEGTAYAMFTTFSNSALLLAPAVSSNLLRVWDVSKATLEANELSGFFKLSVLTTILQMSPLAFLSLLPNSLEELHNLSRRANSGSSAIGGTIFLSVVFFSMVYIFAVAALNIVCPGWAGESR